MNRYRDDSDNESLATSVFSLSSTVSHASAITIGQQSVRTVRMDEPPPAYSSLGWYPDEERPIPVEAEHHASSTASTDPRASSTDSLGTIHPSAGGRRTLLLVYVHGFLGSEISFKSFPAHVHNLLAHSMSDTHYVHTKIFPRYISKLSLLAAINDLSQWLTSHEDGSTDIILLGHSMGGILAADAVLLTPQTKTARPLRHRILGTVNFDTPFLGMNPAIFKKGLSSLLKTGPLSPRQFYSTAATSPSSSDASLPSQSTGRADSFSSQVFDENILAGGPMAELRQPLRNGINNALNLIKKSSQNLKQMRSLVASHLEFGGALFDYDGLKVRYCKIRMLEERENEKRRVALSTTEKVPRVRFVNYVVTTTGKFKKGSICEPSLGELPGSAPGSPPAIPPQPTFIPDDKTMPPEYPAAAAEVPGDPTMEVLRALQVDEGDDSDTELSTLELGDLEDPLGDDDDDDDDDESEQRHSANASEDGHERLPSLKSRAHPEVPELDSKALASAKAPLPPDRSQFPDKKAFRKAFDDYRAKLKTFALEVKKEHDSEVHRLKRIHKAQMKERKENIKRMADTFKEETKTFNSLPKDQRKSFVEFQQKTAKSVSSTTKDTIRSIRDFERDERKNFIAKIKEEGKRMQDTAKAEREALLEAAKEFRTRIHYAAKLERTANEAKRTMDRAEKKAIARSETVSSWSGRSIRSESNPSAASTSDLSWTAGNGPLIGSTFFSDPGEIEKDTVSVKSKKPKTFCTLPLKDSLGTYDPAWIQVPFTGLDEVGAHCSIFTASPPTPPPQAFGSSSTAALWAQQQAKDWHYESLVRNVADMIETWVLDDMSDRLVDDVSQLDISR